MENVRADHTGETVAQPRAVSLLILVRVRLYREGLARALGASSRIGVLGTAADVDRGLAGVLQLRPAVALVDLDATDRLRFARACARAAPAVSILALTVSDTDEELLAVAQAGISGYVTHDSSLDQLIGAVESAARGELLCSPRVAAGLMRQVGTLARRSVPVGPETRLTARELEILELIDEGLSNKEIARELYIELPTVKNHVHNILEKLSVGRRAQAAAKLREHGLLGAGLTPRMSARLRGLTDTPAGGR